MSLQSNKTTCCPSQATLAWCLCKAGLAYAGRGPAKTHEGRPGAASTQVFVLAFIPGGGRSSFDALRTIDSLDLGAADHLPTTILDNPTFSRPLCQEEGP